MALLLSILSLISYGATDIAGHGVDSFNTVLIVAGLALIAPFIYVEKIVKFPVIEIKAFREPRLTFSLFAALLQALGYLSVIFILIMYLQGIRGFTPLTASLLLVPGYVVASLLAPRMGRLSDHIGAGLVAGIGIFLMAAGVLIYFTLKVNSSLYLVVLASIVSGIGGALFWPSNNSAVMSSAPRRLYGSVSGLLRTLSSIGTLMSYVITISVASLAIPRYVAFEVFLGTNKQLTGGVSSQFLGGLHAALLISLVLLIFAGILSILKSGRKKGETFDPEKGEFKKKIDASPQGED
jgi:MFS family permease